MKMCSTDNIAANGRSRSSHPTEVALITEHARFGDNGNSIRKCPNLVTLPLLKKKNNKINIFHHNIFPK